MQTASVHSKPDTTSGFIQSLEELIKKRDYRSRSDEVLANFLLSFFKYGLEDGSISEHETCGIYRYLPTYIREAFDLFRTRSTEEIALAQDKYFADTDRNNIPDIIDIGSGSDRGLLISSLSYLVQRATGNSVLRQEIETYFRGQDMVLKHSLDTFLFNVYRNGFRDLFMASTSRGMSGTFGTTTLRKFDTAGRVILTFARQVGDNEESVTFVADESEVAGVRTGVQSVWCNLVTACSMIQDVVDNWPEDRFEQKMIFVPSNVGII